MDAMRYLFRRRSAILEQHQWWNEQLEKFQHAIPPQFRSSLILVDEETSAKPPASNEQEQRRRYGELFDRDKWLYERRKSGVTLRTIREELAREHSHEWQSLDSDDYTRRRIK